MKYNFTNNELKHLDEIQQDLIISLFDCKDKRYALNKAIKIAYLLGREMNTEVIQDYEEIEIQKRRE